MSIRTIKNPAGRGSITVESVITDAKGLRAQRTWKSAPASTVAAKTAKTAKTAAKTAKTAATKTTAIRKPNAAFLKAMTPSPALAAVIGAMAVPRTEVTSKLWAYIKKNDLQDPKAERFINADDKLKEVFGKSRLSAEDLEQGIFNETRVK